MTVVDSQTEQRVILPRHGLDDFWTLLDRHYIHEEPLYWKYMAMLALRINAGWPNDRIGKAFGHPRGHVSRCIAKVMHDLRQEFEIASDWLEDFDEEAEEPSIHESQTVAEEAIRFPRAA